MRKLLFLSLLGIGEQVNRFKNGLRFLGLALILIVFTACVDETMLERELERIENVKHEMESALAEVSKETKGLLKSKLKSLDVLEKKLKFELKHLKTNSLGTLSDKESLRIVKDIRILLDKDEKLDENITKALVKEKKQKLDIAKEKSALYGAALREAISAREHRLTTEIAQKKTQKDEQTQKIRVALVQLQTQKLGIEKEKEYKKSLQTELERNRIENLKAQIEYMLAQKEAQIENIKGRR